MVEGSVAWEVIGLTKRFAGVTAVNGVSLRIRSGEIHGLVGENGSGKSTLIKMLSGAHQPDDGMILKSGSPVVLPDPSGAERDLLFLARDAPAQTRIGRADDGPGVAEARPSGDAREHLDNREHHGDKR